MKPETHATPTAQDIIAELNALGNPDKAAHPVSYTHLTLPTSAYV